METLIAGAVLLFLVLLVWGLISSVRDKAEDFSDWITTLDWKDVFRRIVAIIVILIGLGGVVGGVMVGEGTGAVFVALGLVFVIGGLLGLFIE